MHAIGGERERENSEIIANKCPEVMKENKQQILV
jgi:hypothetical protein